MFIPIITRPTRLTAHTATLIDNIFTNCLTHNITNGIIINDISDHLPIFASFNNEKLPYTKTLKTNTRDYNDTNFNNFQSCLWQVNWSSILTHQDPNEMFEIFVSEYSRHFEDCFPLKTKHNNPKKPKSLWITKGLLASVRKKNRLYKKLLKHPTLICETQYKTYKNKLNHLIRIAKKMYYDDKFQLAKNNLKETWKLINEVTNKKKQKQSLPSTFQVGDRLVTDPTEIANGFCKFFSNIGPSLANKLPAVTSSFRDYLGPANSETIFLKPTSLTELRQIFNISLETGVFPDKLKMAKIIPIFKADDPQLFKNYRPISLLTNFSKFYERVMHSRLLEFAERFEIL